ncbi:MAG: RagB/SusD family nutrient uptake outer membrane protein [Spirosomaceae bacterium]|nr:RagB/SusD family nutrient uptake outer membrane protein [Spirosomataceae bacterium]
MKKNKILVGLVLSLALGSCTEILSPKPIDILADQFVLNEAKDVQTVRIGAYNAFRGMASPKVMIGDFTADFIQHNGTFTDYQELGNKQITAANGLAGALWGGVYSTVYVCNFLLEKLPTVPGVTEADRKLVTAEAKFLRGMAYFTGATTFGGIPNVTTTDVTTNRTVARASKDEIMANALKDIQESLTDLPEGSPTQGRAIFAGYATKNAARAALARYYLYTRNWTQAEQFASQVIATNRYDLVSYIDVVARDFNPESIFEMGYTAADDPGTSNFGLNNILVGRREVIPANSYITLITNRESGERSATVDIDFGKQGGGDNGWSVVKYGTPDEDNNNIVIFRLAEMYLIRAEARAQQANITGAVSDLNVLRTRAGRNLTAAQRPPMVVAGTQSEILGVIERERVYELSFEGHRWYDLVRTGRAQAVMSAFTPNWNQKYELWPIPQTEIQRNSALAGQQNPGY